MQLERTKRSVQQRPFCPRLFLGTFLFAGKEDDMMQSEHRFNDDRKAIRRRQLFNSVGIGPCDSSSCCTYRFGESVA